MNTSQIHEALQQVIIADPVSESLEPDPDSIFAQAISEMEKDTRMREQPQENSHFITASSLHKPSQ